MRGPEATIRTTGAAVCIRPDESTRAESTQANSNSAAENAAMGPHCSVFFPGWRKTRLWGLSKHIEVAEKARKGAAKRQKRQKSPQWGPECHTGPMQRGPLSAFSAILRAKPCNRRFPAKKKPAKRYEHLAGIRSDALNPLRTQHVYWARKESRAQSTVACESILDRTSKTPLRHGITAFSLNRKALAGPPLSPGQWTHGETGWWPFRGIDHARFLVSKQ